MSMYVPFSGTYKYVRKELHLGACGFVMEVFLLVAILVVAVTLTAIIMMQKSKDDGLSSTIVGGNDTQYGKDQTKIKNKRIQIITIVCASLLLVAVFAIYFSQPVYSATEGSGGFKELTSFFSYFKKG